MSDIKTKIGALWIKTLKSGKKLMTGSIEVNGEKIKVVLFKNEYKKEPKQPDYILYIDNYEPKNKTDEAAPAEDDPDIPF